MPLIIHSAVAVNIKFQKHMVCFEFVLVCSKFVLVSSNISFLISGTRHEKLVSIDRFSFSFLILCDSVVTLVYLADLCI